MAAGKLILNKASGGVLNITPADGATNTEVVLPDSGTLAKTSDIQGFKNYIINGNFDVWQRGTSFNIPALGSAYTSDRWFIYNGTDQEVNISKANMSPFGLEPIPRIRIAFTVAPTSGNVYVAQKMELMQELSAKTVTTQVLHSSLESLSFNGYFTQYFGSGGSELVVTSQPSDTSSGDLTVKNYVRTVTLPSVKDKTIGSNYFTEYVISLPIRSTHPFSIAQVQLEEGSVATPFEQRPYWLELSLCQRYYEIIESNLSGMAYNSINLSFSGSFKVTKRVIPSMTSKVNGVWIGNGQNGSILSVGFPNITTDGVSIDSTSFTNSVITGYAYALRGSSIVANAEL